MIFDHEKLKVYQKTLEFIELIQPFFQPNKSSNILEQLERASNSIALNIAEGSGKFTPKDKCKFYDIARGSAVECSACLDILLKKNFVKTAQYEEVRSYLVEIVSMLIGLIKSTSDRVYEDGIDYS